MQLPKYSMGVGDRFGCQAKAQLTAFIKAKQEGVDIAPVWNKSYREHSIINTKPSSVKEEADAAVEALKWKERYFVDADHIGLDNVELFMDSSSFFTLDVADSIGKEAPPEAIDAFIENHRDLIGKVSIPSIEEPFIVTEENVRDIAGKYLSAVGEAGRIYRTIEKVKGASSFVTEISMDETDLPQTPLDMLFILAAIADECIPVQTIAPKFTGRFNKGIDYMGDIAAFSREFEKSILIIAFVVQKLGLPHNLKVSIHSGSDKFSLYAPINRIIKKHNAGLHLKTAGTTWLEELIGLAMSGGKGLEIAKSIYEKALGRFDEMCAPYAPVIDIKKENLPSLETVKSWSGTQYATALRHDQQCSAYNQDFRQLLHVSYKIAAEMGATYLQALQENETVIGQQVSENIFERHMRRIFL